MVKAMRHKGASPMDGARVILAGMRIGTSPWSSETSSVICVKKNSPGNLLNLKVYVNEPLFEKEAF